MKCWAMKHNGLVHIRTIRRLRKDAVASIVVGELPGGRATLAWLEKRGYRAVRVEVSEVREPKEARP